jgi:hypothetical protein
MTLDVEHCRWKNSSGEDCKDSRLVHGAHFCYRHYWQALWSSNKLSASPLPNKTDWSSLGFLIFLFVLFIVGYIINPDWILPQWINTVSNLLEHPETAQKYSGLVPFIMGWFGVGGNLIVGTWLMTLVLCFIPLRPKIRRRNIIFSLILEVIFLISMLVAIIIAISEKSSIQAPWIASSFTAIAVIQFATLIFLTADTLNPRLIGRFGILSLSLLISVSVILPLYWIWYGDSNNPSLITMRVIGAVLNLLMGYLLLTYDGRKFFSTLLIEFAANLADALRPLDAYLLGFTDQNSGTRSQALNRALTIYSNLTPIEQSELDDYIITKRKPTVLQTLIGILAIISSAFLLEAPAQQLFLWVACKFLGLGAPLCF